MGQGGSYWGEQLLQDTAQDFTERKIAWDCMPSSSVSPQRQSFNGIVWLVVGKVRLTSLCGLHRCTCCKCSTAVYDMHCSQAAITSLFTEHAHQELVERQLCLHSLD